MVSSKEEDELCLSVVAEAWYALLKPLLYPINGYSICHVEMGEQKCGMTDRLDKNSVLLLSR